MNVINSLRGEHAHSQWSMLFSLCVPDTNPDNDNDDRHKLIPLPLAHAHEINMKFPSQYHNNNYTCCVISYAGASLMVCLFKHLLQNVAQDCLCKWKP